MFVVVRGGDISDPDHKDLQCDQSAGRHQRLVQDCWAQGAESGLHFHVCSLRLPSSPSHRQVPFVQKSISDWKLLEQIVIAMKQLVGAHEDS